jgi:hypothetical protein
VEVVPALGGEQEQVSLLGELRHRSDPVREVVRDGARMRLVLDGYLASVVVQWGHRLLLLGSGSRPRCRRSFASQPGVRPPGAFDEDRYYTSGAGQR